MPYDFSQATFSDFRLQTGAVLPTMTVAYCTVGSLSPDGRNAILVTHGYTAGPDMILPDSSAAEGAWGELIGPGKPIDTDRYFVICPNMLGSSYGSTGPASTDPRTGKEYGPEFPDITMVDIVASQRLLLDHLGVTHLAAVAGPSFGGIQALQWAVSYPDFMDAVVAVTASTRPPRAGIEMMTAALSKDPNWNGGRYYESGGVFKTLQSIRVAALKQFGIESVLADSFPSADLREREIERMAQVWAQAFDANSLIVLMKAALAYDVSADLSRIRVPVLLVLSRTDPLFPPSIAPEIMESFRLAGVAADYFEIDSEHGHSASSVDAAKWAGRLREFLSDVSAVQA